MFARNLAALLSNVEREYGPAGEVFTVFASRRDGSRFGPTPWKHDAEGKIVGESTSGGGGVSRVLTARRPAPKLGGVTDSDGMTRRASKTPFISLLVIEFLILFFALEHYFAHRRWRVKTLTDVTSGRIVRVPVEISVSVLRAMPRPAAPLPEETRVSPWETNLYRVHARLVEVHWQLDRDLHLVISDLAAPEETIVAEIPDPSEARGTDFEEHFRLARAEVRAHARGKRPSGGWPVVVTGVGFFDFTHFQPGAAASGFELHPVIEVRFEEPVSRIP